MWAPASKASFPAAAAFLRGREGSCCALCSRLVSGGGLEPPQPFSGDRLYAYIRGGECLGAVLASKSGWCFALLGAAPPSSDEALANLLAPWFSLAVLMSPPEDGPRFERALGSRALETRANLVLSLEGEPPPPRPAGGILLRRALPSDFEALAPLQEAYEREEVIPSIHAFDPRSAQATLKYSLERQVVLAAFSGGRALGKAQTNARGLAWDQLGGVYVEPGFRGRGIATALVSGLCGLRLAEGRRLALFVRPENAPARAAYRRVGFRESGALRIAYHS